MMKFLQRNFLFRFYFRSSDEGQILVLCSTLSMGLLAFRVIYTGHPLFAFLAWNLFLAAVPYVISKKLKAATRRKGWKFVACAFVWLLCIPNAFYIVTDLFHLDMNEEIPLWFDLALLLSFAWSGLLFGILSVRHMEKSFETMLVAKVDLAFVVPIMGLNGLGVYIGRYLRFNSWDVITSPLQLISDTVGLFVHPLRNRFDWSMIVCYTVLLTIIYYSVKKLGRALK